MKCLDSLLLLANFNLEFLQVLLKIITRIYFINVRFKSISKLLKQNYSKTSKHVTKTSSGVSWFICAEQILSINTVVIYIIIIFTWPRFLIKILISDPKLSFDFHPWSKKSPNLIPDSTDSRGCDLDHKAKYPDIPSQNNAYWAEIPITTTLQHSQRQY